MVLFIPSDLPKVALHGIARVHFGVIVYNNLLELFVLTGSQGGYILPLGLKECFDMLMRMKAP